MLNLSRHSWTGIQHKAERFELRRNYYWTNKEKMVRNTFNILNRR